MAGAAPEVKVDSLDSIDSDGDTVAGAIHRGRDPLAHRTWLA
jgi:hypothetical protein